MKKFAIGIIVTTIVFTFNSLSINSYIKNNINNFIYDNRSNSVNSLAQATVNTDTNSSFKHIGIVKLYNGEYIIVLHDIQEQDIIDRIRNIEENQVDEEPRNSEIVKPIQRTIVKDDFGLENINQNNNITVNDPGYKYEWDITYTEADKAWPLINQKREVKVAVLDTGIDYTHPDLENRVVVESGYNFVDNNYETMDDNGHGTHVSGIIAAQANNGIGLVGIAGNLDVKIIPVKVLDETGYGEIINIAKGIIYAVNNGADIIRGCSKLA